MSNVSISDQGKVSIWLPNGKEHVMYEPFPKQIEFHKATQPNFLAIGSRGSGKTKALRFDAHMRALSVPGCNLILIRKTFPDLVKTHIQDLITEMPLLGGVYHQTNHIAYYPNGSKLHLSYVGTAVDGMNLLSAEYLAAYYDEISTIPWEFFVKLSASVRVSKTSGIGEGHIGVVRAATNPLGPSAGEVQKYFVDKNVDPEDDQEYNPADWGALQINMEDNPYLDIDQYKKRFAGMPEHVRKAWLEGEFSNEAALFNFIPKKDGKPWHLTPFVDPDLLKKATIYRAYDHGYSPDPAYCLWIAHLGNRFIAFQEQVWYRTIVEDIARDMREMQKRLGIEKIVTTYCDPTISIQTGADIRTIRDKFEDMGIPMECSINNRELYSSAIHSALSEEVDGFPKFQIYQQGRNQGCPYLAKTLPMMQYNPKRPQAMADHKDDHACFPAETLILTENGNKRIIDISPSDRVMTSKGWRSIQAVGLTLDNALLSTVTFSNGTKLTGTNNHPIWTPEFGWVNLGDLKEGTVCEAIMSKSSSLTILSLDDTQIHQEEKTGSTSNLMGNTSMKELNPSIEKFGKVSTAPSQKDIMFTTKMGMPLTTLQKTWSAFQDMNIFPFMEKTGLQIWNSLQGFAPWPMQQIEHQKHVSNGPSLQKNNGSIAQQLHKRVFSVSKDMKPSIEESDFSSVQGLALPNTDDKAAKTTLQSPVQEDVVRSSVPTNTQQEDFVTSVVHVVQVESAGSAPVYNLTVNDVHEYYANGIRVSNCVAAAYFLISNSTLDRRVGPTSQILRPWQKLKTSGRITLGKESVRERLTSY